MVNCNCLLYLNICKYLGQIEEEQAVNILVINLCETKKSELHEMIILNLSSENDIIF